MNCFAIKKRPAAAAKQRKEAVELEALYGNGDTAAKQNEITGKIMTYRPESLQGSNQQRGKLALTNPNTWARMLVGELWAEFPDDVEKPKLTPIDAYPDKSHCSCIRPIRDALGQAGIYEPALRQGIETVCEDESLSDLVQTLVKRREDGSYGGSASGEDDEFEGEGDSDAYANAGSFDEEDDEL